VGGVGATVASLLPGAAGVVGGLISGVIGSGAGALGVWGSIKVLAALNRKPNKEKE
jgi:hypothetical protein